MLLSPMEIVVVTVGTVTVFIGDWHHDRGALPCCSLSVLLASQTSLRMVAKRDASLSWFVVVLLSFLGDSKHGSSACRTGRQLSSTRILRVLFCRTVIEVRGGYKKKIAESLIRFISRWWMSVWKCLVDVGKIRDI